MRGVWFHKRTPGEGVGYGIASGAGLLVTIAFVGIATLVSLVPWLPGYRSALAAVLGVAATIPAALVFLAVVRRHCDDPT